MPSWRTPSWTSTSSSPKVPRSGWTRSTTEPAVWSCPAAASPWSARGRSCRHRRLHGSLSWRSSRKAGAERPGVAGAEGFAAGLADDLRGELVAAVVLHDQRRPVVAGQVLVAPAHQGDDDRVQVAARGGQVVLEAGRVLGVRPALEDSGADQGAQAGGQGVARRPGLADHLVEPPVAEEDLADGQQCPLLADDIQGASDRAGSRFGGHVRSLPHQLVFWTHWVRVGPDFGLTSEEARWTRTLGASPRCS